MKFENKGRWVRQITESKQRKNEGLYVDPSNYDKHSGLVDVVDKAGNPQKMTQATYDKNKNSGEFKKTEPKEKSKEPDRLSKVIDDIDPEQELQDNDNYSFIKANLPKDPLARKTKLIEIGNKYKDKDLRRKSIWNLLAETDANINDAMAVAMGLDIEGLSAGEQLDKIVDNLDFEN